jgi:hypothetical protein
MDDESIRHADEREKKVRSLKEDSAVDLSILAARVGVSVYLAEEVNRVSDIHNVKA